MKEGSSVLGGAEATNEEHVQTRKQPEMWSPASPRVTVSGQGMKVLADVLVLKVSVGCSHRSGGGNSGPCHHGFPLPETVAPEELFINAHLPLMWPRTGLPLGHG